MKILSTLILTIFAIGYSNNTIDYSGDYFSLTLGDSWNVEEVDMVSEIQTFTIMQTGIDNTVENGAVLTALNQVIDPEHYINNQISSGNEMFEEGGFGDINDCTFLGVESVKTTNSTIVLKGILYYCKLYCFVKDNITFLFFTYQLSKDNINVFDEVWDTFSFKEVIPKEHVEVINEIRTLIIDINSSIELSNGWSIGDNDYMVGMNLSDDNNYVTYKFQFRDSEFDSIESEIFDSILDEAHQSVLEMLIVEIDNNELIRKIASQNITFEYEYYNRLDRLLYKVTITPEDYNNYQKN